MITHSPIGSRKPVCVGQRRASPGMAVPVAIFVRTRHRKWASPARCHVSSLLRHPAPPPRGGVLSRRGTRSASATGATGAGLARGMPRLTGCRRWVRVCANARGPTRRRRAIDGRADPWRHTVVLRAPPLRGYPVVEAKPGLDMPAARAQAAVCGNTDIGLVRVSPSPAEVVPRLSQRAHSPACPGCRGKPRRLTRRRATGGTGPLANAPQTEAIAVQTCSLREVSAGGNSNGASRIVRCGRGACVLCGGSGGQKVGMVVMCVTVGGELGMDVSLGPTTSSAHLRNPETVFHPEHRELSSSDGVLQFAAGGAPLCSPVRPPQRWVESRRRTEATRGVTTTGGAS